MYVCMYCMYCLLILLSCMCMYVCMHVMYVLLTLFKLYVCMYMYVYNACEVYVCTSFSLLLLRDC